MSEINKHDPEYEVPIKPYREQYCYLEKGLVKTTLSKVAVMAVISFLVAVMIYASAAESEVFGLRTYATLRHTCWESKPTSSFYAKAQTCCDVYLDGNGNQQGPAKCETCQITSSGEKASCERWEEGGNSIVPPSVVGSSSATPPSPPPPTNVLPPGSINNTGPVNVTTTTIKIPPGAFKAAGNLTNASAGQGNTGTSPPPPTLLAKQPTGHHHHKGGGQTSTSSSSSSTNSTGH